MTSCREKKQEQVPSIVSFDPCLLVLHQTSNHVIEKFRCDLSLDFPTAFLECLVPSIDKIKHDHCYSNYSLTNADSLTTMYGLRQDQEDYTSKCGRILNQRKRVFLFWENVCTQSYWIHLPNQFHGDNMNDEQNQAYILLLFINSNRFVIISYMKALNKNISVRKFWFIIHPVKAWLGTSPHGLVEDLSCSGAEVGLLEFSCQSER